MSWIVPTLTDSSPVESEQDSLPSTPPPSLATLPSVPPLSFVGDSDGSNNTKTYTYPRTHILALAPQQLQTPILPNPRRLSSFSPILRNGSLSSLSDPEALWGVDEASATILDGEPISKILRVPDDAVTRDGGLVRGQGKGRHPASRISTDNGSGAGGDVDVEDVLFHFSSAPSVHQRNERALPIMIGFANPFASALKVQLDSSPSPTINEERDSGQTFEKRKSQHAPAVDINITTEGERRGERVRQSSTSGETLDSFPAPDPSARQASSPITQPRPKSNKTDNGGSYLSPLLVMEQRSNALRLPFSSSGIVSAPASRSISPSGSISSLSSSSVRSRGSLFSLPLGAGPGSGRTATLNPFAAPFPLPQTTPRIPAPAPAISLRKPSFAFACPGPGQNGEGETKKDMTVSASLPPPKTTVLPALPSSLPAKPGPLPPVFVKRESAALPQPMALPDIVPLGQEWEGEAALSGNEKRRRCSAASASVSDSDSESLGGINATATMRAERKASVSLPSSVRSSPEIRGGALSLPSSGAEHEVEPRPERLVNLGRKLRSSVAQRGAAAA